MLHDGVPEGAGEVGQEWGGGRPGPVFGGVGGQQLRRVGQDLRRRAGRAEDSWGGGGWSTAFDQQRVTRHSHGTCYS